MAKNHYDPRYDQKPRRHTIILMLLTAVLPVATRAAATKPEFSVNPQSINCTCHTVITFTCTARNTESIVYRINGTAGSLVGVREKGFNQLRPERIGQDLIRRNLSVSVKAEYNNTEILCEADGSGVQLDVNSLTANMMVQGRLSSVANLSCSLIDSSTVNISWSPPFTLPGTDITGYNVSTTDSNGTMITNDFTPGTVHNISIKARSIHKVAVSAFNGMDGETTTVKLDHTHSSESMTCDDSDISCILYTSLGIGIGFFVLLIMMIVVLVVVIIGLWRQAKKSMTYNV